MCQFLHPLKSSNFDPRTYLRHVWGIYQNEHLFSEKIYLYDILTTLFEKCRKEVFSRSHALHIFIKIDCARLFFGLKMNTFRVLEFISLIGAPSDPKIFFPPINVLNMSWDQNSMIWALEKIGTFNLLLMLMTSYQRKVRKKSL